MTDNKSPLIGIHDVNHKLKHTSSDTAVERTQHIPEEFIRGMREEYDDSMNAKVLPDGSHRVARIPTAVVEKWLMEGFNIYEHSHRDIIKRLREEHLDYFITTKKAL